MRQNPFPPGPEPTGFGETRRKVEPPHKLSLDTIAPFAAICTWLTDYALYLRDTDRDPQAAPQINAAPQPGKPVYRFTIEAELKSRDLADILLNTYNRLANALHNRAADCANVGSAGAAGPLRISHDGQHWGKFSLEEITEKSKATRNGLFLWKADQLIPGKSELVCALRALAVDATAALEVPDHDPAREAKKNFDHSLKNRLAAPASGNLHFYCHLHTTAAEFPAALIKMADAIQRGEIGASRIDGNWGFCFPETAPT